MTLSDDKALALSHLSNLLTGGLHEVKDSSFEVRSNVRVALEEHLARLPIKAINEIGVILRTWCQQAKDETKTFYVIKEPYSRHGAGDPPELLTVKAKDLNDLALQLKPEITSAIEQTSVEERGKPFELFMLANGDGDDYFRIYYVVDGKLVEIDYDVVK